jgi:cytochrome c-type biogenesis protein CcmH/NrfG
VALILAIIFCVGAVGIGVGQGVGNVSVLDALSCADSGATETTSPDARIVALLAAVTQNPNDVTNLQALASAYVEIEDYANAATYLEKVIEVDPTQKDVYFQLSTIYMNKLYDYSAALALLNKAQTKFPTDPEVYLQLGLAQRSAGNTSAAIMAWQKYLTLAPNGDQADTIRDAITTLSAGATTTTTSATTSTTAASTSSSTNSTAAATSTTASASTTTSAAQ